MTLASNIYEHGAVEKLKFSFNKITFVIPLFYRHAEKLNEFQEKYYCQNMKNYNVSRICTLEVIY